MANGSTRIVTTNQVHDNANVVLSASFPAAYSLANTALQSSANIITNLTSNTMSVEGNIMCANATSLLFGGNQGNTANALFSIVSNVSSNSLDFLWI